MPCMPLCKDSLVASNKLSQANLIIIRQFIKREKVYLALNTKGQTVGPEEAQGQGAGM